MNPRTTSQGDCRALTGAWIETVERALLPRWPEVAPSRARGLKLVQGWKDLDARIVAPSRARGLKPDYPCIGHDLRGSRPHGRVD
ncbi:conserved hypothetical protein [Xanthomonas citri pv. citri]|nr:conserved hypothetical protein [Xanthomonas citri pv. citri]CEE72594.1 conserved hypothetical protein [Xanthomonas citri pv. citri]CEL46566.1 conserved hypothetical protein [Xanthomonas citri pv. citri]